MGLRGQVKSDVLIGIQEIVVINQADTVEFAGDDEGGFGGDVLGGRKCVFIDECEVVEGKSERFEIALRTSDGFGEQSLGVDEISDEFLTVVIQRTCGLTLFWVEITIA